MVTVSFKRAAATFALGAIAVSALATETQEQAPRVEPDATRILKRMTDYLGSLQRFSLDTENTLEDVLVSGQKIQYDFTTSVVIRRPNKLRAERTGDLVNQLLVYDGENLTIYNRESNYYAIAKAPDNLDDMLHFARDTLDLVPPSGDLVYTNAFDLLTASLTSGVVVGKSMVGGVRCDHLAFRGPVVDWQIWIADGDEPLPHKYVLTTRDDPSQPEYIIQLSNWNVTPRSNDALFDFSAPKDAKRTEFLRMNSGQKPGR
jgi:hypothetical protein